MKIDIAVFIAFDCHAGLLSELPNLDRAVGKRTFTMRFDTEDTIAPAQFCNHYPPRADTPDGKAAKCWRCAVTVDLDKIDLPNRCHKNCPLDAWWAQQKQRGVAA